MPNMAITGIGGFIGLRLAERALERGMSVQGLELSAAGAERARQAGAKVRVGDVTDPVAVREALEGADIVVHTAAVVEEDGPRELYQRVNVLGTRNVARIASELGSRKFIQVSSVMVYGFDFPDGIDELGPYTSDTNPYNATKLSSEREALVYHRRDGMQVTILRPGDVYGPGSRPWVTRPLELLARGDLILPAQGRGLMNLVHIDNLVDAMFLAIERDADGEAFNITDDRPVTAAEYFGQLANMIGIARVPTAPSWLLRFVLRHGATIAKLQKRGDLPSPAALSFLSRRGSYDIGRARRLLGYEPRVTLEEGLGQIASSLPQAATLVPSESVAPMQGRGPWQWLRGWKSQAG